MTVVPIEEAQDHLAELVRKAVAGEPFIISEAGKPLVTVAAVSEAGEALTTGALPRVGFMKGQFQVPDDFDEMYADEIADMFEGRL